MRCKICGSERANWIRDLGSLSPVWICVKTSKQDIVGIIVDDFKRTQQWNYFNEVVLILLAHYHRSANRS